MDKRKYSRKKMNNLFRKKMDLNYDYQKLTNYDILFLVQIPVV